VQKIDPVVGRVPGLSSFSQTVPPQVVKAPLGGVGKRSALQGVEHAGIAAGGSSVRGLEDEEIGLGAGLPAVVRDVILGLVQHGEVWTTTRRGRTQRAAPRAEEVEKAAVAAASR